MEFEQGKTQLFERNLGALVSDVKGVRKIRGCSSVDLRCYKISFGYQRRDPFRVFLLIYYPTTNCITLCADGGIMLPPENVRQRLMMQLGTKNYTEDFGAYSWNGTVVEDLLSNNW